MISFSYLTLGEMLRMGLAPPIPNDIFRTNSGVKTLPSAATHETI
jgi:hypothetical protein